MSSPGIVKRNDELLLEVDASAHLLIDITRFPDLKPKIPAIRSLVKKLAKINEDLGWPAGSLDFTEEELDT